MMLRVVVKKGEGFEMEVRVKAKSERKRDILEKYQEFFSKMSLFKADKSTIVLISEPVVVKKGEETKAKETTAIRFCKVGEKETKVELVTKVELGDTVSKRAAKRSFGKHLAVATDASYYFAILLESGEASEEDGRAFGEQLMKRVNERMLLVDVKKEKERVKDEVVKAFVQESRALREIVEKHGFTEALLCADVRNKLRRNAAKEGIAEREDE